VIALSEHLAKAARGDQPVEEVIGDGIKGLQDCHQGSTDFRHISELAKDWLDRADERFKKPDQARPLGVPTGISRLNDKLAFSGLPRGHMTVVGAVSSGGKSALLDNGFVLPAAMQGQRVCLCSLEDSGRSVFVRHLSHLTKLSNRTLQQEIIETQFDWLEVMKAASELSKLQIWILDVVPRGVDQMIAQIRRHVQKHGADLIGIDYLQFIRAGIKTENRTASAEYVISAIAALARELEDTATVLLSQYRKLKEDKQRPSDDDLRDANSLRFFAHTIMHVWCPQKAIESGCKVLTISKNKQGPVGDVIVSWRPRIVSFFDPTDEEETKFKMMMKGGEA
jgi:replicative DNA helicase